MMIIICDARNTVFFIPYNVIYVVIFRCTVIQRLGTRLLNTYFFLSDK